MAKVLSPKQRAQRDQRICKMYEEKEMSTRQIAKKVGLSKTRVHEIVAYEN